MLKLKRMLEARNASEINFIEKKKNVFAWFFSGINKPRSRERASARRLPRAINLVVDSLIAN